MSTSLARNRLASPFGAGLRFTGSISRRWHHHGGDHVLPRALAVGLSLAVLKQSSRWPDRVRSIHSYLGVSLLCTPALRNCARRGRPPAAAPAGDVARAVTGCHYR